MRVEDFGIRSYDLAYAIMEGYDAVILVDATPRGQPPGTVSLIEPDMAGLEAESAEVVNAHSMNPGACLADGAVAGRADRRGLYLVGCEPAVLETDELGLSPAVQAAVPQAANAVQALVGDLCPEAVSSIGRSGDLTYF